MQAWANLHRHSRQVQWTAMPILSATVAKQVCCSPSGPCMGVSVETPVRCQHTVEMPVLMHCHGNARQRHAVVEMPAVGAGVFTTARKWLPPWKCWCNAPSCKCQHWHTVIHAGTRTLVYIISISFQVRWTCQRTTCTHCLTGIDCWSGFCTGYEIPLTPYQQILSPADITEAKPCCNWQCDWTHLGVQRETLFLKQHTIWC